MHIIIAGDGKVGSTLARQLAAEKHDITLIDNNHSVLTSSMERLDVMAVHGNCAAMDTLLQAGVKDAELLIAATSADEVNLLCCTTAHGINPKLHTIARIRNPEYTEQIFALRNIFGLSMSINPEKQAAREIARLLKYPGFLRRDTFVKGRVEIVELRIEEGSKLCNVSLSDMHSIVKAKVLVCAVLRNGTAVAPNGNFVLQEGDRIFVTAPTENLTILLKNLGIITKRARHVILCGGGRVSYYLAAQLDKDGVAVQIIESDHNRCLELAELLPNVAVIHGDATDQNVLEAEGLLNSDALVSLTGIDELNMIISLYAGSRGVPQVITKLGHAENRNIIDNLSLGSIVCPKDLCCNQIIRYVRAMQNQTGAAVSLHTIADGQAEAVEFMVDERTLHCDTPLKDLKLKPNVLIASISHGSKTEIPNGNSTFRKGDSLVIVTSGRGVLHQLNDIFA
ncbi:MAG: Trk system potassium transporter TrkA [Oscillospiraceae bacterium]|nr:Trk system potassium transporter TrkA [Oscillospiraceae bacterium]